MTRFNGSKKGDWDENDDAPAGERSSGVRARAAPPSPGEKRCTTFDEAYRRYQPRVWSRIAERLPDDPGEVADVQQRVFLRLDRRIHRRGRVPDPLLPVLYGLVDDAVSDHRRAAKRRRTDGPPDSQTPSSKPDPEQIFARNEGPTEEQQRVQRVLAEMCVEDIELLRHAHMRELSLAGLAADLGISVNNATVRLYRARARFRALYELDKGSP